MEKESIEIGPNKDSVQKPDETVEKLYTALFRTERLYRKPSEGDALYYFAPHRQPVLVPDRDFYGRVHDLVSFTSTRNGTTVVAPENVLVHPNFLKVAFHSSFKSLLRPFETVLKDPAVVFNNGKVELTKVGYDPRNDGIYLVDTPLARVEPVFSTEMLDYCFSDVPFDTSGRNSYKSNVIASLLGAIVLDNSFENPLVAVTGNQPGIGKTKLTAAMGYILTGTEPSPVSYGEQMRQELSVRFRENQRFIMLDNVTTPNNQPYRNDQLAMHVTSGHSKKVRELGVSRDVSQRGVLFVLTANHCQLQEDLQVRALMVKLERKILKKMIPYVWQVAFENRNRLFAELLGLALSDPAPYDENYKEFFRFRNWLRFVAPRVEAKFGTLAIDESIELDSRLISLCEWAVQDARVNNGQVFTCKDFFDWNGESPLHGLSEFYAGLHGSERKGKAKSLSTLFINMKDRSVSLDSAIVTLRYVDSNGPGKTRRFLFHVLKKADSDEG